MALSTGTRSTLASFGFESVLIVFSILVALAIDSWWDDRREARLRADLVQSLTLDFEATRKRLGNSIAEADDLIARSRKFLDVIARGEHLAPEEMRHNLAGAFNRIEFEPALSAYEGSIATGTISLLENPGLLEAITGFNQARHYYDMHDRIAAEIFYLGPIWELRKEIGSLRILIRNPDAHPQHLRLTDEGYRKIYNSPLTYAAIEAMVTAQRNSANGLRNMLVEVERVMQELERMR